MANPLKEAGEGNLPRVEVDHVSLDRGVRFLLPDLGAAKDAAVKAMGEIFLDEGIQQEIEGVQLNQERARARIGWDYYGFHALKTDLGFEQKPAGVELAVHKVFSEGTSLRQNLEKVVGRPSLPAYAYVSVELPSPADAETYLQQIKAPLDPELLTEFAQDQAFWEQAIAIRDITVDQSRVQDMGKVVLTALERADEETQLDICRQVIELVKEKSWIGIVVDEEGILDQLSRGEATSADVVGRIFSAANTARRLKIMHPGVHEYLLLDSMHEYLLLDSMIEVHKKIGIKGKEALYDALHGELKSLVAELGGELPREISFDYERMATKLDPGDLSFSMPVDIKDSRISASVSTSVKGTFDLEAKRFQPAATPTRFSINVQPASELRDVENPELQDVINGVASKLALQDVDFVDRKLRRTKADKSHYWAIDKLAQALLHSDDPTLQNMATDLLEQRHNTGRSNPEAN